MNHSYDDVPTPPRVREPVQVYLDSSDRERLERLTGQLEATKSDVLRRGLDALERQLFDPDRHPALRLVGLFDGPEVPFAEGGDPARDHDRVLAEAEEASWSEASRGSAEAPGGRARPASKGRSRGG